MRRYKMGRRGGRVIPPVTIRIIACGSTPHKGVRLSWVSRYRRGQERRVQLLTPVPLCLICNCNLILVRPAVGLGWRRMLPTGASTWAGWPRVLLRRMKVHRWWRGRRGRGQRSVVRGERLTMCTIQHWLSSSPGRTTTNHALMLLHVRVCRMGRDKCLGLRGNRSENALLIKS